MVYTRRLVRAHVAENTGTELFTVPPFTTVIVRDILIFIGGAGQVNMYVASGDVNYQIAFVDATELGLHHSDIRQALEPGDVIHVLTGGAGSNAAIAITGYVFT